MPVKPCQENNRSGFKYGDEGKCYPYKPNNKPSRERARNLAEEQGKAIRSNPKNK